MDFSWLSCCSVDLPRWICLSGSVLGGFVLDGFVFVVDLLLWFCLRVCLEMFVLVCFCVCLFLVVR